MGTGYTRNDVSNNIADGNIINASDLDGEFDAIEAAFVETTGHTHDGTADEGAPITVVGPVQDFVVSATEIKPKTTNTLDIGTSLLQFKDLYIDGTGYIDAVDVDGGTIDGTTIGGSSAAAGTFTTFTSTGIDDNASSTAITIDSSQNVGIGAAPTAKFEVQQNQAALSYLFDSYNTTNGGGSIWRMITRNIANTGTTSVDFYKPSASGFYLNNNDTNAGAFTAFGVGGTERMRIDSSGNVGIGTIAGTTTVTSGLAINNATAGNYPGLEIQTAGVTRLYLNANNAASYINSVGATSLSLYTNSSNRLHITSSGNVGISQTNPLTTLHVTGGAMLDGLTVIGRYQTTYDTGGAEVLIDANASTPPMRWDIGGTEVARIDGSGRLGLGTSAPSDKLHVVSNIRLDGSNFAGMNYYGSSVNTTGVYTGLDSGGGFAVNVRDAGYLVLSTSNTERMRIDSSGNVGIGTSPTQKLDVSGQYVRIQNSTSSAYAAFEAENDSSKKGEFGTRGSTAATYGALAANNTYIYTGTSDLVLMADSSNNIKFAAGGSTERMRIDSSGNLLVNTTSPPAGSTHTIDGTNTGAVLALCVRHLATNSNVRGIVSACPNYAGDDGYFYIGNRSNGDRFYVRTSGNVANSNNVYGAISDIKLKENIVDASPKLDDLKQVRIVNFNFKDEPDNKLLGVVAQELEEVFPGMIEENRDRDAEGNDLETTSKSVKYSVFVPMLIKALQEQQEIIEALEARVAALEI